MSKGKKLEILMNCDDRLEKRLSEAFGWYHRDVGGKEREYWWGKVQNIWKAKVRIIRKINKLLNESE